MCARERPLKLYFRIFCKTRSLPSRRAICLLLQLGRFTPVKHLWGGKISQLAVEAALLDTNFNAPSKQKLRIQVIRGWFWENSLCWRWLGHLLKGRFPFIIQADFPEDPSDGSRWRKKAGLSEGHHGICNQLNKVSAAAVSLALYQSLKKVKHLPFTVRECRTATFKGISKLSCLF